MIRKGRKIVLSVAQVMIPPGTLESPIFSSIDLQYMAQLQGAIVDR